jgi:ArsR family transcriptional regulator
MVKNEESLERLIASGRCTCSNVDDYVGLLKEMAEEKADTKSAKKRSKVFKAMGDVTRQRILSLLQMREMCVCEIITAFNMTQPTTSHHLKILEDADLISSRKEGKWIYYGLNDKQRISELFDAATR